MSSSDYYYIGILYIIPVYLHQYVATILYIIGNIGNILSISIFLKKSWRKNVCVFYFLICLFTNTVFVNSTMIGAIFNFGFNINLQNSHLILCKLFYYVSYLSSIYYPFILIFASFDRLLISSQNVDTRLYSSKRLAYLCFGINTFVWSIFSLHILIKVHIQEIYPTIFICFYDLSISYLNFFFYSTLVISAVIPMTLVILSILAFKNVRRIRAVPSHQQRQQIRTMTKKDFQLLRCLYIHNIVYIIFSLLIVASVCYNIILKLDTITPMQQAVIDFLANLSSFLHYIPYCTSFFIFICVSKAFRQELKRFGYTLCCKNFTIAREEENHHHHQQQQQPAEENIGLNNIIVSTIVLHS